MNDVEQISGKLNLNKSETFNLVQLNNQLNMQAAEKDTQLRKMENEMT